MPSPERFHEMLVEHGVSEDIIAEIDNGFMKSCLAAGYRWLK